MMPAMGLGMIGMIFSEGSVPVPHDFQDIATFEGDFDADALSDGVVTAWANAGPGGGSLSSYHGAPACALDGPDGHRSVSFDGVGDALSGFSSVKMSTVMSASAMTLLCICYIRSIGASSDSTTSYTNRAVIAGGGEYQGLHIRTTGPSLQAFLWDAAEKKAVVTTETGKWVLLQQRLESGLLYGRSGAGAESAGVACGNIADLGGPIFFGVNYTTQYLDVKIARALFSKTALGATPLVQARSRLSQLYGVAV